MAPDLLVDLGEKNETAPEIIAVMEIPADDLDRIDISADFLGVLFDRPTSPGNIGSIIRSADAFGAGGMIVTGSGADVYDSKCVRASTGSIFALPTVRVPSHREVMTWLDGQRERGRPVQVVGADEQGDMDIFDFDLTKPTLLLVGNETAGLSVAWRDLCDRMVSIPMTGTASSLNAANAATAALYEASVSASPLGEASADRLDRRRSYPFRATDRAFVELEVPACCRYVSPAADCFGANLLGVRQQCERAVGGDRRGHAVFG